jgi:hypothetical protein
VSELWGGADQDRRPAADHSLHRLHVHPHRRLQHVEESTEQTIIGEKGNCCLQKMLSNGREKSLERKSVMDGGRNQYQLVYLGINI